MRIIKSFIPIPDIIYKYIKLYRLNRFLQDRFFHIIKNQYPKIMKCNICEWQGRIFLNNTRCPLCFSLPRHRFLGYILHNIELFDLNNRTEIIKSDVMRFLKNHKDRYDIIFADPPYRTYQFKELFPLILSLLNKKGIFCYESDHQNLDIECGGNMKIKRYGQTQVILWENI